MISDRIFDVKKKARVFVAFDSVQSAKVDFAGAMLKNAGGVNIPSDYAEFLKNTNGMIATPFEFYGTEVQKRNNIPPYNFPNIVDVNMVFLKDKNPLMVNRIVVGMVYFDLIIFDGKDKKYKLLHRTNFAVVSEFKNFDDVLGYVIKSL